MIPIEQYPDIAPPTIMVETDYPVLMRKTVLNSVVASVWRNLSMVLKIWPHDIYRPMTENVW